MRRIARFCALVLVLVLASCRSQSAPTPGPTAQVTPLSATAAATSAPAKNPFATVSGIVDANNLGWPRTVTGLNGKVVIPSKPQRIVTLSVGHDEVTYGLVPSSRIVAVGSASKDPTFSNTSDLTKGAVTVKADPEAILAQKPDIMVTSPYVSADLVKALTQAGLPVIQTALSGGDRVDDILLLGYIYGEEARAIALAAEVQGRYNSLRKVLDSKPGSSRPKVLSLSRYQAQIYTAGKESTEASVILAAGGIGAAAEAGLSGHPVISIESIASMRPDVIMITQAADGGGDLFRQDLLTSAVLADVPAIKNGKVFVVGGKYYTTLSYWNLRGSEELAKILWPSDFAGKQFGSFSLPPG